MQGPSEAIPWERWLAVGEHGIPESTRVISILRSLRDEGIPDELFDWFVPRLFGMLRESSDPLQTLIYLQRFIGASRSPHAVVSYFQRDSSSLSALLRIFSVSQYLAEQLIADPDTFDLLRMTDGQSVARGILIDEICAEVDTATDDAQVLRTLRTYRHRETLRIAYGDFVGNLPVEQVIQQNSFLADAICEAAYRSAWKTCVHRYGLPQSGSDRVGRMVILALGKLGGSELNYASDIDLMFLGETHGSTVGRRSVSNGEFFDRLAQQINWLIHEVTPQGRAYRVDLRLRPFGAAGPLVSSLEEALQYYDRSGRTWERQALIKARPIAGDLGYGQEFIHAIQPWIYRRHLSGADITGIRTLKRRIEKGAQDSGLNHRNVKTGRGGIRDIEFTIQFLQLLNGPDWPPVRSAGTLPAIAELQKVGCLTPNERSILEENYRFLRRIEHHLQITFDHQTHTIPGDASELRKLAIRAGYSSSSSEPAEHRFQRELLERTSLNRGILDHLLHDPFGEDGPLSDETELILDPEPSRERIIEVLTPHGFRDPIATHRWLLDLASERISFLSSRRSRHFLAAIAEKLIAAVAKTPDPETTLINLSRVSDSLGGKAALWELFSVHPPSMNLGLRLCATSPYLVGILTSNPGMLDELMDSLVIDRLPDFEELESGLDEMCRGAADIEPMLHAFKNSQHLRIGTRDILGKEPVASTHAALSDIAEICVGRVIRFEYERLCQRMGKPMRADQPGREADLVVVALGKLGGREPNYHSDLDVLFFYDGEGTTEAIGPSAKFAPITNEFFFQQLVQRIVQSVNRQSPFGRLYDMDIRLRPSGSSGSLVTTADHLAEYFQSGQGQLWERLMLCKARTIWGRQEARQSVERAIRHAIIGFEWSDQSAESIAAMRMKVEQGAGPFNLKRGIGGTMDVEFIVQMLQLRFARDDESILIPGTMLAMAKLTEANLLSRDVSKELTEGYRFLRQVESRLRLTNSVARHDLPTVPSELNRLAYLLGMDSAEQLLEQCHRFRQTIRRHFLDLTGRGNGAKEDVATED